jgi:Protein of unknown function (DUF1565)
MVAYDYYKSFTLVCFIVTSFREKENIMIKQMWGFLVSCRSKLTTSNEENMIRKVLTGMVFAALVSSTIPAEAKVWHVSKKGRNSNDASKEKPLKNIDRAVKKSKSGDTIKVAEGTYMGTFKIGYVEFKHPVKIYGGFSSDFSKRDPQKYQTLFQPNNASGKRSRKAFFQWKSGKKTGGTVIDGFIFDMGERNNYHAKKGKPKNLPTGMLILPPGKGAKSVPTVTQAIISFRSGSKADGGVIKIENNVFVNGANFAIQAAINKGTILVRNNVFINNRMASVEIFGACRKAGPKKFNKCGKAEVSNNTILFTWTRRKDLLDMGYGIRIMGGMEYNIHHNIIGTAAMTGIENCRFNENKWIKMDKNVFFGNKKGDLQFCPKSNTKLMLKTGDFDDLEFASVKGNKTKIPKTLPINKKYLTSFLVARYKEKTDYNPKSSANKMRALYGLNKQGTIKSKISMFANRYPWKESVKFFGAVSGVGAQKPKK